MTIRQHALCIVFFILLQRWALGDEMIDSDFGVVRIATGCRFTEGPAVAPNGELYFSDGPNDRIMRLSVTGELDVFLSPCGAANGLSFDSQGDLLMCQSARENGARAVARLRMAKKTIETITSRFNDRPYIAPNDLCVDRVGHIYFTDPYYDGDKSQPVSGVYRVDGRTQQVKRIIDNLARPNGIALSPDQSLLYVSDRGTQKLHRYRLTPNGDVVPEGIVFDFSPNRGIDGMAIDVMGNIYGAAGEGASSGLFVISPDGKLLQHLPMPEFSTNVAFGGKDFRDLYLTATTSVYKLRTRIPGLRAAYDSTPPVFSGSSQIVLESGAGEGPAWNPRGFLVFSGHGRVNRLTDDGQVVPFQSDAATNGLMFDQLGRLLRCEPPNHRVTRVELNGAVTVLADRYQGKPFNQPNDLTVDRQHRVYFTDPKYGPYEGLQQFDEMGRPVEGVYRIDAPGKVERIIRHEVDRPNGILVTRDERYLVVADNNNNSKGGPRKLYRFEFHAGEVDLQSQRLMFDWGSGRGPDGMAEDRDGRIYVAAGRHRENPPYETTDGFNRSGIYVFDIEGNLLAFASIPRDEVTNCTFGGEDGKTLFVTAGGSLWKIRTTAAGYGAADRSRKDASSRQSNE